MTKTQEKAKKKKKLLEVDCADDLKSNYEISKMSFAFVSSPAFGRKQVSRFYTCRDGVSSMMSSGISYILDDTYRSDYYVDPVERPMDFDKMRLLMVVDKREDFEKTREKIFSGKAMVNYYEDIAGWKRSKITTVKHKSSTNAWLLTGPKEWMGYSQLVSIVTLIMRIAYKHGPVPEDLTPPEFWKYLIEDQDKKLNSQANQISHDVNSYLRTCAGKFTPVMKNVESIFTRPFTKEAYTSGGYGGFVEMCKMSNINADVKRNFKKVLKKENGG